MVISGRRILEEWSNRNMVETALAIAATSPVGIALVNRISDAVGWYFVPRQIVRRAEAEAQAELIRVRAEESAAEIDIDKLIERAEFRSTIEKIVQQTNFEAIVAKALLQLSDSASPDRMDQDWLWNFFDRCRYVSDDDMQEMWARVLAGEANLAGSYSRRSVNIMGDFDTHGGDMFSTYCRFIGVLGERHATPFIVTGGDEDRASHAAAHVRSAVHSERRRPVLPEANNGTPGHIHDDDIREHVHRTGGAPAREILADGKCRD